jgi:hypothetical protein
MSSYQDDQRIKDLRTVLTYGIVLDATVSILFFAVAIVNLIGGILGWYFTLGALVLGAGGLLLLLGVVSLRARIVERSDQH